MIKVCIPHCRKIKIIGLTGGIGSGKSTVANLFEDMGAYVIDADKIAHDIMDPGMSAYNEVLDAFGYEILNPDKSINRKSLAKIVFNDKSALEQLNSITHKYIFAEIENKINYCIKKHEHEIIILDVPLLFNSDFPFSCDRTIAVVADKAVRIKRTVNRDDCTAAQVEERMKNQLSDERLTELADYIINNSSDLTALHDRVNSVYNDIIKI